MQKGNVIILVLGILVITAGILVYFEASSYQEKSKIANGMVIHVIGSSYRVQYFTEEGTEKVKNGSGKTHGYREGDVVKLWYRTDNPDRARLADGKKGSRKIIIAGAFCILLGIYPLFMKKKDKPTPYAS